MDVQTFLVKLKFRVPDNVRATARQYERLLATKSSTKRSKVGSILAFVLRIHLLSCGYMCLHAMSCAVNRCPNNVLIIPFSMVQDVLCRAAVCVELACLGSNESFPRVCSGSIFRGLALVILSRAFETMGRTP